MKWVYCVFLPLFFAQSSSFFIKNAKQKYGFNFHNPLIFNMDFKEKYGFSRILVYLMEFCYSFVC